MNFSRDLILATRIIAARHFICWILFAEYAVASIKTVKLNCLRQQVWLFRKKTHKNRLHFSREQNEFKEP